MSHIETRYTVNGEVVSTDTTLLDAIESALPAKDNDALGNEYSCTRSDVPDSDKERLSARMTFTAVEFELDDGTTITPKAAAESVYQAVVTHDLAAHADDWAVRLYRSPEGGVLTSDVQAWYEEDPTRQPEREVEQPDGSTTTEQYVPSAFDPENHIIKEVTG